jgi:hypothetical protein
MDREAVVLRAEMSRTRAALDQKLSMLHAKVRDLTPRRLTQRYLPEYFADRLVGSVLTLIGVRMAWTMNRLNRSNRSKGLGRSKRSA